MTESTDVQKKCLHYSCMTDYGLEHDCEYNTVIVCDACTFVVGYETGDKRRGRKPWAKCNMVGNPQ